MIRWLTGWKLIASAFVIFVAAGTAQAHELEGTKWKLAKLPGMKLIADSKASLAFDESGKATGNGSCNSFSGTVTLGERKITFGPIMATKMFCQNASVQEDAYFKALADAETYELSGNELWIYSKGKSEPIVLTRLSSGNEGAKALTGTNWKLKSPKMAGRPVTLSFTEDGKIAGQAPVNRYFGSIEIIQGTIKVGPLGTTMMAGPEEHMKSETAYFDALSKATGVEVFEGEFRIFSSAMEEPLVFTYDRQPAPAKAAAIATPLAGSPWILVRIDGSAANGQWIKFSDDGMKIEGVSDSRSFSGPVKLKDSTISVGLLKISGSSDPTGQDARFVKQIQNAASMIQDQDMLSIYTESSSKPLVFKRM